MRNEHMDDLGSLRHSLAHLLAAAVLKYYPEALLTIGPEVENGFYYDIQFSCPPSEKELPMIEKTMRGILRDWDRFEAREVAPEEARKIFRGNPFKLELIDEIVARGEPLTLYRSGQFEDLCRGGHVQSAKHIPRDAFKLWKIAGCYWRGDSQRPMLTRIYGLAFRSKEELDKYMRMLEEAEKRDHRKLGAQLDLFTFSELVGPGLPLWTPSGTVVREELNAFVWELRRAKGYEKVEIPHLAKKELYLKSGHWEKFANDLFKITTREGHEYALKPMNCPHHAQIYQRKLYSYRELPQRYANTTMVYRDEQSGELSGLSRVLCITQDDAHVFCRKSQIKEEFFAIWDVVDTFYQAFGFTITVRLSLHDPKHFDAYLGTPDVWKTAEQSLKEIAEERGVQYEEAIGEAAMYGPKIDFMATDSLGRVWQVAAIQLDMNQPERFDLVCANEEGKRERIVMIHAAIMGSIERFLAVAIEHLAGNFPLWLAPIQLGIMSVSDQFLPQTLSLVQLFGKEGIRVRHFDRSESVAYKIREAAAQKIPYGIVIGAREAPTRGTWKRSQHLSIRVRGERDPLTLTLGAFIHLLDDKISRRALSLS